MSDRLALSPSLASRARIACRHRPGPVHPAREALPRLLTRDAASARPCHTQTTTRPVRHGAAQRRVGAAGGDGARAVASARRCAPAPPPLRCARASHRRPDEARARLAARGERRGRPCDAFRDEPGPARRVEHIRAARRAARLRGDGGVRPPRRGAAAGLRRAPRAGVPVGCPRGRGDQSGRRAAHLQGDAHVSQRRGGRAAGVRVRCARGAVRHSFRARPASACRSGRARRADRHRVWQRLRRRRPGHRVR